MVLRSRLRCLAVALSVVVIVSGCRQEPRPDYFGSFAVVDDSVRELVREPPLAIRGSAGTEYRSPRYVLYDVGAV